MPPLAPDEDALVRVASANLKDRFEQVEPQHIEWVVRRAVKALCDRSRVKAFVGILAERRARRLLERHATDLT
jgi:hypothetical protein